MNTTPTASIAAIIPAAGRGQRMGGSGNKLLMELAGIPVLVYVLKTFDACPLIAEIVIPSAPADQALIRELVQEAGIRKVTRIVEGGEERQESVARALQAVSPQIEKVVVHDGARPLLTLSQLESFLREAMELTGAVMAVPVKDTIKKVNPQGWVIETPPRAQLWAIQTPQFFARDLLASLHRQAAEEAYLTTDDAALLEWQGHPVRVLPGSYENIKVTTPEDLLVAQAILDKRQGGQS